MRLLLPLFPVVAHASGWFVSWPLMLELTVVFSGLGGASDGFRDLVGVDIDGVYSYHFGEPVVPPTQPPTARGTPMRTQRTSRLDPVPVEAPRGTPRAGGAPPALSARPGSSSVGQLPLFVRPKPSTSRIGTGPCVWVGGWLGGGVGGVVVAAERG